MLPLGFAVVSLAFGSFFFALGARGTAGMPLQLGRNLFLLCVALSVAAVIFYAVSLASPG